MSETHQPVGSVRTSAGTSLLVTTINESSRSIELQSFTGSDGEGWHLGTQRVVVGAERVEQVVWLLQEGVRLLTKGRPLWSEPAGAWLLNGERRCGACAGLGELNE